MEEKKNAPQERGAEVRRGSKSAKMMELIVVETTVGEGSDRDPMRTVVEVWLPNGELLAANDPVTSSVPMPSRLP